MVLVPSEGGNPRLQHHLWQILLTGISTQNVAIPAVEMLLGGGFGQSAQPGGGEGTPLAPRAPPGAVWFPFPGAKNGLSRINAVSQSSAGGPTGGRSIKCILGLALAPAEQMETRHWEIALVQESDGIFVDR